MNSKVLPLLGSRVLRSLTALLGVVLLAMTSAQPAQAQYQLTQSIDYSTQLASVPFQFDPTTGLPVAGMYLEPQPLALLTLQPYTIKSGEVLGFASTESSMSATIESSAQESSDQDIEVEQTEPEEVPETTIVIEGAFSSTTSANEEVAPTPAATPTETVTPTVTPVPIAPVDAGTLEAWFQQYGAEYGVDPEIMKRIAQCESGLNPGAVSPTGAYHGLFQFVASTWSSNRNAMGLDPNPALRTNPEEAIRTAAFKMGRDGFGAWPVCGKRALSSV